LLNCYGVPNTILSIKEFGGPHVTSSVDGDSLYEYKSLNHAVSISGSAYISGSINGLDIKAMELRFRTPLSQSHITDETVLTYLTGSTPGPSDSNLYLSYSGSTKGWIMYEDSVGGIISSSLLPIYDGNF